MSTEATTALGSRLPIKAEPRKAEPSPAAAQSPGPAPNPVESVSARSEDTAQSEMERAVEKANERAEALDRKVRFKIDRDSGEVVVRVVNAETDEVIRQIPPQELVELSQKLEGSMEGLLIEIKA